MDMAQASAGLQAGIAESETLIIFKSAEAMAEFVDKGWEAGGGGAMQAGAAGKSVGVAGGENAIADARTSRSRRTGSRPASRSPGRSTGRTRT